MSIYLMGFIRIILYYEFYTHFIDPLFMNFQFNPVLINLQRYVLILKLVYKYSI